LAFGINRVEGQGGLYRTRTGGEYDQPIARQVEIDILQVVGPGTPDSDILHLTNHYTPRVKCGKGLKRAVIRRISPLKPRHWGEAGSLQCAAHLT